MREFKKISSLLKALFKIGSLFVLFFITTNILSYIFFRMYKVIIFALKPEFNINPLRYINYLNNQLSSLSSFPSVCLILIQCISMILWVGIFWIVFEKKQLRDIGIAKTKSSKSDLCFGALIGAMSFILVAFILLCTKSVRLENGIMSPYIFKSLIIQLIVFIFVGINEELFARGYCINILKENRILWGIPIVVSSVIFSLMHSMNEGISALAYINLFLFGIFMGCIYIKTKSLWMCIGYHTTWNYFQGPVFGFLVSGASTDSIYKIKIINSNIINGGSFGPEGGIVVTILLVVSILISCKSFIINKANRVSANTL